MKTRKAAAAGKPKQWQWQGFFFVFGTHIGPKLGPSLGPKKVVLKIREDFFGTHMGPKNIDRLKKNVGWTLGPIWVPKIARRRRAKKIRVLGTENLKNRAFRYHMVPKNRAPKARENF